MDAEETVAQEVFPLGDAVSVAVGLSVTCHDPHFGITGFDIEDVFLLQGDLPVFGIESDGVCRRKTFLQPRHQQVMPIGEQGQDGRDEDRIPKHRREIPEAVIGKVGK